MRIIRYEHGSLISISPPVATVTQRSHALLKPARHGARSSSWEEPPLGYSPMCAVILLVFVGTLVAVITRPRGLNEGVAALAGAALMVLVGAISPPAALQVVMASWNIFLFFLGMLVVTGIAEQAGIFVYLASLAAQLARGSQRRLLLNVFLIGVVVSTFLTNDATALVLTPIVYSVVRRLELDPLPYLFACTFIADTASLTLPVSNPINLIFADHFDLGTTGFLRYLFLPSVAAIAINIAIFFILFRRRTRDRLDISRLPANEPGAEPAFFRDTAIVLGLLAAAFVIAGSVGIPAGAIAACAAAVLLAVALRRQVLEGRRLVSEFSWSIFPFVAGLFVVVRAVERAGLTAPVGHLLHLAGGNVIQSALLSTATSAIGTNLINNVPMALVLVSSIPSGHNATEHALVYGSMLGCDLGPNITTTGSLSTMLWLLLLRRRGLEISSLDYIRYGVIVTPLMLLIGAILVGVLA